MTHDLIELAKLVIFALAALALAPFALSGLLVVIVLAFMVLGLAVLIVCLPVIWIAEAIASRRTRRRNRSNAGGAV